MSSINKYIAFPEHAQCRLLVCDGSAIDAMRLAGLLESMGYTEVTTVSESRHVMPTLLGSTAYDTLLMDLRMPHLDGLKIIYLIRRKFSSAELPILAITDADASEICHAALLAGANELLIKPIDPIDVALRIRNLLTIHDIYKSSQDIRNNLEREVAARTAKLNMLIENGLLMSLSRDRATLMRHTLFEGRRLLHCDAATMYLMTDKKSLRFSMRTREDDLADIEIPLYDPVTGLPNVRHASTWCALHKKSVCIDNVYQETRFDLSGTRNFDAYSGYRTVSMLTVAMISRGGDVVGVLQFINKLDSETNAVTPFPSDLVPLVEALAAQAAVTFDNLALNDARLAQVEASHQLENQIAQLDRQRSLGNLSASLGHELSQPLTAIMTNAQVARRGLQARLFNDLQVTELLDKIVLNTQRAGTIVDRIRKFIRPSTLLNEAVNLNLAVIEVAELVSDEAKKNSVIFVLPASEPVVLVSGDPIQISQIVLNVLRNAIEAVEQVVQREIHVSIRADDGRAILQIHDTGPGLSPEALAQVGMPFFTTKQTGLGMGISISRHIAEQHAGTLTIGNADCGGALVKLNLPVLTTHAFP